MKKSYHYKESWKIYYFLFVYCKNSFNEYIYRIIWLLQNSLCRVVSRYHVVDNNSLENIFYTLVPGVYSRKLWIKLYNIMCSCLHIILREQYFTIEVGSVWKANKITLKYIREMFSLVFLDDKLCSKLLFNIKGTCLKVLSDWHLLWMYGC